MLYTFQNLDKHLTELGFPEAIESSFRIDFDANKFKKAVSEGTIQFRIDGIYLIHNGKEWKGYMYMPKYKVKTYNSMPRFHLTRCEKIEELFTGGHGHLFKWSNNKLNDIEDRDTSEFHPDEKLQLCKFCSSLISTIKNTEDFFDTLDLETPDIVDVEVDIFGYTFDWNKRSRNFRKEKDYTCEKCEIKISEPIDRRFIHVHHKDGNKIHNDTINLESLCVLCHANKDSTHQANFGSYRMQSDIKAFIQKYRNRLNELGNPYLESLQDII